MKKWSSKVSMGIAFVVLAIFLTFWVHQEYEREVTNLTMMFSLEEAKKIITDQDQNMEDMLSDLNKLHKDGHVEIQIAVDPESRTIDTMERSFSTTKRSNVVIKNIMHSDSSVLKYDMDTLLQNEIFIDGLSDGKLSFTKIFQSDPLPVSPETAKQAMFGIWPQITFAIVLYALLIGSIALMKRSHRFNQVLMKDRNNLVSNLTHELKTPVSTISVALEALKDFNVDHDLQKRKLYMDIARKEVDRLSDSIDMVMQLNALDNEAILYRKQKVSLFELSKEVNDIMIPRLEERGMSLTMNENDAQVFVDKDHMKNALLNIVDNAIKYGKPSGKIEMLIEEEEDRVRMTISDDGPGISNDHQKSVFDRFYRVQNGDQHNVKGHGLGLSYAKETIEAHNGKIDLFSELGKGCRFEIELPKNGWA